MTTNETKQDNIQAPKPRVRKMTDNAVRRRMGWAMTMFCEARFDVVRKALSPEKQANWDSLSYAKKCAVVLDFVQKGYMI